MTTTDQKLREEIMESRAGQSRWRCPKPLRERIVAHARERRRQGVSLRRTARALGLSESGLRRWVRAAPGQLRRVRVVEPAVSRTELALVTPGGYRLEGLDVSTAAEMLRRLGC